jgi:putative membrane-bound dehydrogenase-like protein
MFRLLAMALALLPLASASAQTSERKLKLLFLGDNGHHRPAERFRELQPELEKKNIELVYTDTAASLDPKILAGYDGLVIYANQEKITPEQENALLEYVEGGKGLVALHCASFCFLNSPKYIALVGGQFQRHGTGVVETARTNDDHPILKDFRSFKSWDETYVHTKHNDKDRIVLETRDEKGKPEPWTWVRTQGKGRVFYTAWGHDGRTWTNPGFHNLVERGIRWATGGDPTSVAAIVPDAKKSGLKPFEYQDAKVPFYPESKVWGKTAEPLGKMQKPLDAAESIKHMVVPKGMKAELFAADPDIFRPICMNWDEKGRLWIAETRDYPNELKPKGEGRDRIVICEDLDGDNRADRFTVFADKLSIPTSFTFSNGGIIVAQAPDFLFLKDTDGDGKADLRKVLFTGWGTGDTHAGPSSLTYGPDNWIYGMVGYSGFKGEVGGERHSFSNGFFRFKPDGSKLEFLRNNNNNCWGVGFSEDGILFGSTANGNGSVHLPIPNRYYEKVRGWSSSVLKTIADSQNIYPITDKVRQVDNHGRFTAAAGHALYTARTYPKEYWNKIAFVCEPTGHLIAHFKLEPSGATFIARNQKNFLASDDEWTSPIMAEVGPDGQVWVIDWYNYIVQHNPTPPGFKTGKGGAYETPLRDKTHGRILRVVYPDGKPSVNPKLDANDPKSLIAGLKSDNLLWRRHAQRLIVERGKQDVVPDLLEIVAGASADDQSANPPVMHALWTLEGLGVVNGDAQNAISGVLRSLSHKSPAIRRAAVTVLPATAPMIQMISEKGLLRDPDVQVRLAALLKLSEIPFDDKASGLAGDMVVELLADGSLKSDAVLWDAATSAAAAHAPAFLRALAKADKLGSDQRAAALIERIAEHYARGGPVDSISAIAAALPTMPKQQAASILTGFAKGWPATDQQPKLDATATDALDKLVASDMATFGKQISLLARRWNVTSLEKRFAEVAASFLMQLRDEKASDEARAAAASGVVELRSKDPAVFEDFAEYLTPRTSPIIAKGVLEALGKSDAQGIGKQLAATTPSLTPAIRPTAIRVMLTKPEWTRDLLDSIDKGQIAIDALSLDQKQYLLSHPTKGVAFRARATFAKGGALPNPDREKVIAELTAHLKDEGDPKLGKAIFTQHCAKCHRHGLEGAKIGPDLTGMAVHPKAHLLTEIMDPNRSVEGNYRQYIITTKAGRVITGLLASESKTAIEVVDAEAKTNVLQREDIDELQATPKSLMPEGFEKQIPPKDLVNLLAFLTERGQYLPLPIGKAATAVSTKGMFIKEADTLERLVFPEWTPQTFAGVPFQLVDPKGDRVPNVILLAGPKWSLTGDLPRQVSVPCNAPAKAVHILGGVGGWAFPGGEKGSTSMIVRLRYADGSTEDHPLKNGEHIADYIRKVDVPDSKFAFDLRGRQVRYLSITPGKADVISQIEFVKGNDEVAPVVMAVTVETRK